MCSIPRWTLTSMSARGSRSTTLVGWVIVLTSRGHGQREETPQASQVLADHGDRHRDPGAQDVHPRGVVDAGVRVALLAKRVVHLVLVRVDVGGRQDMLDDVRQDRVLAYDLNANATAALDHAEHADFAIHPHRGDFLPRE